MRSATENDVWEPPDCLTPNETTASNGDALIITKAKT